MPYATAAVNLFRMESTLDFSQIIPTLERVAPTIASLLGGPLVGMGVQTLESFFGLTPPPDGSDKSRQAAVISAVAGMDPDAAVKLATIDADLKAKMAQAGIDMAKVDADDRNSARGRATAMHDFMPSLLAGLAIVGTFAMVFAVVKYGVSKEVDPMLAGGLIAGLTALAQQGGNYLWGSSVGSAMKNALMDRWTEKMGSKK